MTTPKINSPLKTPEDLAIQKTHNLNAQASLT